jgi:AraC-like DNA-binding protein
LTEQARPPRPDRQTIAGYLLPIHKALQHRGIDADAIMQQAGVSDYLVSDPLTRLPHREIGEVFRLATEATGESDFGLYASQFMLPAHIHALGTAMLASRTLLDMCERVTRYGAFLANTVSFTLGVDKDVVHFGSTPEVPLRSEAEDMFWSFILRFMRHLSNRDLAPLSVALMRPRPEDPGSHLEFFACPVSFGEARTDLCFSRPELDIELPTGSDELAQLSDQVVRAYLGKLEKDDILSRVASVLVKNLPSGDDSKESVARALGMSARTLQNRLSQEGTTWREVLDDTRYRLARSYLTSGRYSQIEVTYLLGFNDPSSFSRAFKRWSGVAPGAFRA